MGQDGLTSHDMSTESVGAVLHEDVLSSSRSETCVGMRWVGRLIRPSVKWRRGRAGTLSGQAMPG